LNASLSTPSAAKSDAESNVNKSVMRNIGQRVPRLEDASLLRGQSTFVDDIHLDGMLHAVFVRSPFAHAKIISVDASAALAMPGVHAVLTHEDIKKKVRTDELRVALPDKNYRQIRDRRILARDETVYVGETIAVIIADDPYIGEDAIAAVAIEYDVLPSVSDCREAMEPNAPVVHADASDNLSAQFVSEYGPVDATFANAPHVFKSSFWQHRGVAHSIECRGCVAAVDALSGKLTLWSSTQTPLVAARILADILDRDEKLIRVVTPEVGGAFGPKLVFYPEEAAVAVATLLLGRPIKWIEDRREHFVATTQERDQYWDAEIAVDGEGKILGVRGTLLHDHGAYTARGLTTPQGAVAALTLAYVVPAYRMGVKVALTNKVPVTPIRGAGQPQGVFVMERLLDLAARELGIDRAEIRRRNLVPASAMPYTKDFVTRGGVPVMLDSGDYPACQESALVQGGWDGFAARQAQARADGRYLGIGVANYVEGTGRGPYEQVSVRVAMNGMIDVATGASGMGQGIRTALTQVVAEQLGGDVDRIRMTTGDSAVTPMGFGGFNSRQAVMAGSSAHVAAIAVREKVLQVAGHLLEVDAADLDIERGDVVLKGARDLKISLADVAKASAGTAGFVLPGNLPPGLDATENVIINGMTYANGTALVEVEVDVALAAVKINRIVFAHDAGRLINPTIVEGQVTGAIAHGIGNALYEWMGYASDGQPLTTNFADYLLVTATEMPPIEMLHHESPTPLNPLGVKGVGESGVLPMAAALASAIDDALTPFQISVRQAPLRPTDLSAMLTAQEAAG